MSKKLLTLVILTLSLFFLINTAFAKEKNKAYLIGFAMVEDISEDEYGLTLLDGLFSIINFRNFPGVDSFMVYSRWFGVGEHKIKAQIIDSEGNIVNESVEGEIIFEKDYETYSLSHDFNNTIFTRAGVYWIQMVLNGEVIASVPLFIRLFGQEIFLELESELPSLVFSLPAIEVYEKENGLQAISGVFEFFMFKRFPAADDFIIVNGWHSGEGKFSQHIEILDPDDNVIYVSESQIFETGPKSITAIYDELIDFIFPKAGLYTVRVYLEEEVVAEYPILVEKF